MGFGYVPNRSPLKNLILRLIGNPHFVRRVQAPVVMRMLEPKDRELILDAGCGGGSFAYEVARICECIGLDLRVSTSLAYASRVSDKMSISSGNVVLLPFRSCSFDKVLLSSVLQMVKDDKLLLRECSRVLKTKGVIVLSVPSDFIWISRLNKIKPELLCDFKSVGKGFYQQEELVRLLSDEGFEILEIEYSPKLWGSLIYEVWLNACARMGFPLFHPAYFIIMYPIGIIDRFASRSQKGVEMIVKAGRGQP